MSDAKYIIKKDEENEYLCNICAEEIENDKIIVLKCNSKHIFCYDCISDWYKSLVNNKTGNYFIKTMCPICRKNGGKLPISTLGNKFNKQIYYLYNNLNYCEALLKNGIDKCTRIKKIGNYCGIHKNYCVVISPNKDTNLCGVKLKSKNGFCSKSGMPKYNGLCCIHGKQNNNVCVSTDNNVCISTDNNVCVSTDNNVCVSTDNNVYVSDSSNNIVVIENNNSSKVLVI
jgi:hypothetical protein